MARTANPASSHVVPALVAQVAAARVGERDGGVLDCAAGCGAVVGGKREGGCGLVFSGGE